MRLSVAHSVMRRRRQRQNLSALQALFDTPAALGDGVTLPANVDLALSTSEAVATSTVLVTANDRDLGIPASAADAVSSAGFVERGVSISKAAGAPGTVSVYARDAHGVPRKIAEG